MTGRPFKLLTELAILLMAGVLLAACSDPQPGTGDVPGETGKITQTTPPLPAQDPAETMADTAQASAEPPSPPPEALPPARPRLRILVPANIAGGRYLPRSGSPVESQREAAQQFAESLDMDAEIIPVQSFTSMIPALAEGRGDILVANMTITEERRKLIDFSVPLTHVREQVLVRADDDSITTEADLAGKRVLASKASSFWTRLAALQVKYPTMDLIPRPEGLLDEEEVDMVAHGKVDAVVRDSNIVDMYLGYRDDIKVAFDLKGRRAIAWGVRKDAAGIREALNQWLHLEHMVDGADASRIADFDRIKERKVLRVLMRNNAASYFLYRGKLMGFEYELAREFARSHKLRLEVIVPPTQADMYTWLKDGRADLAVGFLEPRDERKKQGFAFSRPYNSATRHLVTHNASTIAGPEDLAGRTVVVARDSDYWLTAQSLQRKGYDFELQAADDELEAEDLLARVGQGELDATIADGHILDLEITLGTAARPAFTLGEERQHAVAMLARNTQLLEAVNAFVRKKHRGLVYNVLYKRYFRDPRSIRRLAQGRDEIERDGRLSPWDDIVRRYGEHYGFDWRLLVAQMYQESRFDPKAKSFAGARGLMQVMPRTARSLGIKNLEKPENGIHAGVKYLNWVRDRFDADLPVGERTWFSLAAYNAGPGHVHDARRLARQMGWNPDRWFGHTERAMLLLAKKKYASKAKHGYVRGREPVNYVRNIRDRFTAYAELSGERIGHILPGKLPFAEEQALH